MSLADDVELLSEYNRWRAEKEVSGVDLTPATFAVERAQAQAFDKLEQVLEYAVDIINGDYRDELKTMAEDIRSLIEGD